MNFSALFFQISEGAGIGSVGAIGIVAAIAFIFVFAASAFFSYVMLRKTVKMAFRMLIVALILLIGLIGSVSFLWFSSGGDSAKPRPANSRSR